MSLPNSNGESSIAEKISKQIAEEIAGIEAFMKKDRPAYNKDEWKQARLRELYSWRDGE